MMLYLEEGPTLKLLPGIPRRWLEDGQRISLGNVASYFGPLSLTVVSKANTGHIEARVECKSGRMPKSVHLRLPHPEGKKAIQVSGGVYDNATETVIIAPFTGTASVEAVY